jgi:TRAP-type transport system small permease protein
MKLQPFVFLDRLMRVMCASLMGAMTLAVILSVFFRYVFSMTAAWSEELITMLFISTSFLGTAMVTKDDEHINIDFLPNSLSPRHAAILRIIISVIVIAVQVIVVKASFKWIAVNGNLKTPGLELPYRWFYSLLPMSAIFVCLYEIGKIFRRVKLLAAGGVTP